VKLGDLFYLARWCAAPLPHMGNAFVATGPYQCVQLTPTVRYRIAGDRVPRDFALLGRKTFAEHHDAVRHAATLNRERASELLAVAADQEVTA